MKVRSLVATAFLFLSSVMVSAQAVKPLPSYFPAGIVQTTDALHQREEYMRTLVGNWQCNQTGNDTKELRFSQSESLTVQTDVTSTDSVTQNPAKLKIVLDNYIRRPDSSVQVTSLCGQKVITEAQAQADAEDLRQVVVEAAQLDYDYYKVTYDFAIKARAEKLGISVKDLTAQLDEKVPGYNITFRELHHLPKPSKPSDFVPRELHLGYPTEIPNGILGVTWINTGIIYYNPNARMVDYITGKPKVMAHEMVHGNINFQKFPMSEAFDVEMEASIPEGLWAENRLDLATHGYFADLREIDEIYFNFDFKQMEKDIFKFDLAGNIVYDEAKYKYYYDQLQTVQKENLDFFQTVVIPEFYSDPLWWGAVNNIRGDNNSIFRMIMALHYDPTLLGGRDKTMEWLEEHHDEIVDIAKDAFQAGLGVQSSQDADSNQIPRYLIEMYQRMFSDKERTILETYFRAHPKELQNLRKMEPAQALEYVNKIMTGTGAQ